jgi:hypothetical protein
MPEPFSACLARICKAARIGGREATDPPFVGQGSERNESPPDGFESPFVAWEFFMRRDWTPSTVPGGHDQTVYLVADDFGRLGRAWIEADYEGTDLETVLQDLMSGQYNNPIRVIAFNTAERWSEDVSEDDASEIRRRCDPQFCDVSSAVQDFVATHEGSRRQLTLRLV